ncbi:MAG TPA: serine/threonine-protein kinase [Polyangiaceae bacterium]|nr:serine/threonine-protein kinase [Polyangiaceae bacterium]
MAAVYSATHRNGSRVAIKMLHPELAAHADIRERFLEEGYAANRVGPPGVVAVLDEGASEEGAVFLVMELLEGRTLEQLCADGPRLPVSDVLRIGDEVLSVLERAHENGVVHRDIKPENVFVTRAGEIKLLDFGIAHVTESRRNHHTELGSAMGTPAFMSPEQARGRWDQIDQRSDLWALGATLFWTLSGHYVHEGATVNEELLLAMTVRAKSLGSRAPDVPTALVKFVDRALAFEKSERYADARAMRLALRSVMGTLDERQLGEPLLPSPEASDRCSTLPQGALPSIRPVSSSFRPPADHSGAKALVLAAAATLSFTVAGVWALLNHEPGRSAQSALLDEMRDSVAAAPQPEPEPRAALDLPEGTAPEQEAQTAPPALSASGSAPRAPILGPVHPQRLPNSAHRLAAPSKETNRSDELSELATPKAPASDKILLGTSGDPLSRRK